MGGHIFVYVSILDDHKIILVMPSYALLPSHSRIWGEQWKTNFLPVQKVLLLYIYDSGSFPTFIVNLNVIARIIFTNSRISLTDLSTLLWVVMDACIINFTSLWGDTWEETFSTSTMYQAYLRHHLSTTTLPSISSPTCSFLFWVHSHQ